jgi:hypothetical protein
VSVQPTGARVVVIERQRVAIVKSAIVVLRRVRHVISLSHRLSSSASPVLIEV